MTASAGADWIAALSTAVLGILGITFTGWQWWASRFRPKATARVDARREAIELRVVNRGRGAGVIHRVAVVDRKQLAVPILVEGFSNGDFTPVALPSFSATRLIIMAPNDATFTAENRVKVEWWDGAKFIEPDRVDVGLYVWVPKTRITEPAS
jgi:hypothetical protein